MKIRLTNENKTKGVFEDFSKIKKYLILVISETSGVVMKEFVGLKPKINCLW